VAVTIFGGLISATLLDAFLTPILFLKFGQAPIERLRKPAQTEVKQQDGNVPGTESY
jgi:HME family heavy-metal exporter